MNAEADAVLFPKCEDISEENEYFSADEFEWKK